MRYWIVFITTIVALFWDECVLTIISLIFKKRLTGTFIIIWTLVSGVLASIIVSLHMPEEYRSITMILVGVAVLFSLNGTVHHKIINKRLH